MLDLASMNARIHRGDNHLRALNGDVASWMASGPYELIKERNESYTDFSLGIRFGQWPDLHHWATVAGDAITNYRGALDHLVYALAAERSGQDPPPLADKLAFPVCDTLDAFGKAQWRLGCLQDDPTLLARLAAVQPLGDDAHSGFRVLRRLAALDNAHKHRQVQLAVFAVHSLSAELTGLPAGAVLLTVNEAPLQAEDVLLRLQFPTPAREIFTDLSIKIRIAFGDEPKPAKSMLQVISDCRRAVLGVRDCLV